jgi:hypothetical protein
MIGGPELAKDTVNSIFEHVLGKNSLISIVFASPANLAERSAAIEGCPATVGGRSAMYGERPSTIEERS